MKQKIISRDLEITQEILQDLDLVLQTKEREYIFSNINKNNNNYKMNKWPGIIDFKITKHNNSNSILMETTVCCNYMKWQENKNNKDKNSKGATDMQGKQAEIMGEKILLKASLRSLLQLPHFILFFPSIFYLFLPKIYSPFYPFFPLFFLFLLFLFEYFFFQWLIIF